MSLVTRDSACSMDANTGRKAPHIAGLLAGEAIDAGAPVYIKSSDGKLYMSNGTAANEAAEIVGFAPAAASAGEACSVYGKGARFRYGSGLTPGDKYYIAATAGRLDTAATTGDAVGVAQAITSTDIRITRDA
jgi:hypothetical protein